MQRLKTRTMTQGPLFSGIILYTIPIVLTGLLQLLFNAADLIVVGQFSGSLAVAAVGSTGALISLVTMLFIGLSVGASVIVAQSIGAEDHSSVHRSVHTSFLIAIISGVLLTIIGIFFSGDFLTAMGTPKNVLPLATLYMQIYFCGMPFNMVYNYVSSILRAAGDTKTPLVSLTIAGILNVILNVIFVVIFKLGVAGVALATALSQILSSSWVTLTLMKRNDSCRLILSKIKIYKNEFFKILHIGLPSGIQACVFDMSNVVVQSSINSFGEAFVSGNSAAANLTGFVYVAIHSFMQTSTNYVGQNIGAKNYKRAKSAYYITMLYSGVTALLLGILMYVFGNTLLSFYISDSPEAIQYGVTRLLFMGVPYFLCGLMDATIGALRGMGASLTSMVISISGVCGVRIMWIFTIFQFFRTPEMLFMCYTASWTVTFTALLIAFSILYKKKSRAQI